MPIYLLLLADTTSSTHTCDRHVDLMYKKNKINILQMITIQFHSLLLFIIILIPAHVMN
jgi:hypothetical protein